MLDPFQMLAAARFLAAHGGRGSNDAQLRRAISTAYYAVFHTVLTMAADRFLGQGQRSSAGYTLVYRGFQHLQMRRVCDDVDRPTLSEKYRNGLGRSAVVPEIRSFAGNFGILQDQRQTADYDPQIAFRQSDAIDACDLAELTIASLQSAPEPDRTDFLALLLVNVRS